MTGIDIKALADNAPGGFDGDLITEGAALSACGEDFGQMVFSAPVAAAAPRSVEALEAILHFAAHNRLSVISRGAAHAARGQAQCNKGIVVNTCYLRRILAADYSAEQPWVDVEAGVPWEEVIKHTGRYGFVPPVTPDWQKLSVGGTLSVGGIGFTSHSHGSIADNVLEMDIVTGCGNRITCSPLINSDLFDAARAGLGQYGIIHRVRLRLSPMPSSMHVYQFFLSSAAQLNACLEQLTISGHFECLHAFAVPATEPGIRLKLTNQPGAAEACLAQMPAGCTWLYFVEAVKYDDTDQPRSIALLATVAPCASRIFNAVQNYYDYITKEPPLVVLEKAQGKNPHPQVVVIHPSATFPEFMEMAMGGMSHDDMGGGPVLIMPLRAEKVNAPMLRCPDGGMCYFTGFLRNAFPGTSEQVEGMMNQNRLLLAAARANGASRYPSDAMEESAVGWRQHYGGTLWQRAANVKAKYDPLHLIRSGLNIFPPK